MEGHPTRTEDVYLVDFIGLYYWNVCRINYINMDKVLERKFSNLYGEEIIVKLENGKFYVSHEDCGHEFMVWNKFCKEFYLSPEEVKLITNAMDYLNEEYS